MPRIERRRHRRATGLSVPHLAIGAVAACAIAAAAVAGSGFAASAAFQERAAAASVPAVSAPTAESSPVIDDGSMGDHPAAAYVAEARELPGELTTAIRRDLDLTGAEYLARSAAAIDGADVVASLEAAGVPVLGSRVDGTTLIVNVPTAADGQAVADAGAVAEIGAPAELDLSGIDFQPAVDVAGGEGYAWQRTDGSGSQCSIGFTGHRISTGAPVALTAGHCTAGMASISGAVRVLSQSAPGSGGTWGAGIGSPAEGAFGNGLDGGLIDLRGDVSAQASVLTWGGGAGAARSSAPVPVEGVTAGIVGASLCKSGSRTGWTCGTVRAVDRSVNVGGTKVNSVIATTCIQPGDSGGAALIGRSAVGVNSSTSSAACGSSDYISAFFPMVSAAGQPSVQSQFGGIWEPSLSLTAPSITSMAVPGNGGAGALRGTASATSADTVVAAYIDDSRTAVTTVPIVNGGFTLDLSRITGAGLTPGSHRIRLATSTGSWSHSTTVDTTMDFAGSPASVSSALLPSVSVDR